MKIVHVLKGDPFSWKAHEALRVSIATAINNEVYFVCIRDGVYVLTKWEPEKLGIEPFDKFWETADMIDLKIIAEEEALHDRGIFKTDLAVENVEVKPSEEIKELLEEADGVFIW